MSLVDKFLQYSLTHQRPIKVMLMEEDRLASFNLTVQAIDEEGILYLSARNKKQPRRLRYDQLLSASYARGDDGDIMTHRSENK